MVIGEDFFKSRVRGRRGMEPLVLIFPHSQYVSDSGFPGTPRIFLCHHQGREGTLPLGPEHPCLTVFLNFKIYQICQPSNHSIGSVS